MGTVRDIFRKFSGYHPVDERAAWFENVSIHGFTYGYTGILGMKNLILV